MSTMNKVAEALAQGTQQAQVAIGQTLDGLRANATSAAGQFEQAQGRFQAQADAGLEQAVRNTQALIALGQDNFQAAAKSAQIWTAGVQDISREIAGTMQAQVNESIATARTLASVKSVKEAVEIQVSATCSAIERTAAESSRVAEAYVTLAQQAAAPVLARVPAAIETVSAAAR